MRAGYAARGMVYLIVGGIALFAAINGGEAEGSTGALEFLVKQPFGQVLLGIVAIGLFAYTAWRLLDGVMDLEGEGDDAEGYASRAGQLLSGATHALLGVSAVAIILNGAEARAAGERNTAESWAAALIDTPFGRAVIIAAGIVTICVGIYLFIKSHKAAYRSKIHKTETTQSLAPVIRFGLVAHGVVLLIIGGLIAWAGLSHNPESAAGLGEALRILETQAFGRILLGIAGAGLAGFAIYCFVMARYRIAPELAGGNVSTLSQL
ncbi:MAG: DUF1206 domain-containing protein [Pseudomonadota bacterium]